MTKSKLLLIIIFLICAGYGIKLLLPTKIIAVHSSQDFKDYDIIVKNFPITDSRKKLWWEKNKHMLADKYGIPVEKHDYLATFWTSDYIDGSYRSRGNGDLICFDDMKAKANCIDKDNKQMQIWYTHSQRDTSFNFKGN